MVPTDLDNTPVDVASLREIPLLAQLEEQELAELANALMWRPVLKGKCIIRNEQPGYAMMFVAAGRFKVMLTGEGGKEYVIDVLGPGDFFGELAMLTGEPRSADVEALEDSALLVLSKEDFDRHMSNNSGLAKALLRELAFRLRATTIKVRDLALLDVHDRLARILSSLATRSERDGFVLVVEKRPTHKELAALTGTSREVVTRALRDMEALNQIRVEGRRLILNWE